MSLYDDLPPVGTPAAPPASSAAAAAAAASKKGALATPLVVARKRAAPTPTAAAGAAQAALLQSKPKVAPLVVQQELPGNTASSASAFDDPYDPMLPNKYDEDPALKRQRKAAVAAPQVGQQLLKKAGWTEGDSLGKNNRGIVRPLITGAEKLSSLLRSRVVLLRNLIGAGDVDADFAPEITQECGNYGVVESLHVWEAPEQQLDTLDPADHVRVFVRFDSVAGADACRAALHGRWFAEHQVVASSFPEAAFAASDWAPH